MLLFNDKPVIKSVTLSTENLALVISEDNELVERIKSNLFRNGIEVICIECASLFHDVAFKNQESCSYVVIDICNESNVAIITDSIKNKIRSNIKVVLIGNNDSISFSEAINKHGYIYLNYTSQLEQVSEALKSNKLNKKIDNVMKISVLGTKGGLGLTFITWKLANEISHMLKLPVLYIQGSTCTPDLDLVSKKKIERDNIIQHIDDYLYAKMDDTEFLSGSINEEYLAYNFIVREECIKSLSSKTVESFYDMSNVMIIVISRDVASLKVAKEYLADIKNQHLANHKENFRLYIVMNDFKKPASDSFDLKSIESFLGEKIDLHVTNTPKNYMNLNEFCSSIVGFKVERKKRKWWNLING